MNTSNSQLNQILSDLNGAVVDWYKEELPHTDEFVIANTADFNANRIPQRMEDLVVPYIEQRQDNHQIRILDVGCGYGSIATYLAARYKNVAVTACDLSSRYYRVGERVAKKNNISNVSFKNEDMRNIEVEHSYDIVIMSNVLCYLVDYKEQDRVCLQAWKKLNQNGVLIIYTPHFWSAIEPFTKIPMLQWLPPTARNFLSNLLGKRSTMSDILLPRHNRLLKLFNINGVKSASLSPSSLHGLFASTHFSMWIEKC